VKIRMLLNPKTHVSPLSLCYLYFCCAASPSSSLFSWFHFCDYFYSENFQKQHI